MDCEVAAAAADQQFGDLADVQVPGLRVAHQVVTVAVAHRVRLRDPQLWRHGAARSEGSGIIVFVNLNSR